MSFTPNMPIPAKQSKDDNAATRKDATEGCKQLLGNDPLAKLTPMVEQILLNNLKNLTRITLMEECEGKQCYVNLEKLSHGNVRAPMNRKASSPSRYPMPKERCGIKKKPKPKQKQKQKNKQRSYFYTDLDYSINQTQSNTIQNHVIIEHNKKDCIAGEVLIPADGSGTSFPSTSTRLESEKTVVGFSGWNNKIKTEKKKKPIFKKRKEVWNVRAKPSYRGSFTLMFNRVNPNRSSIAAPRKCPTYSKIQNDVQTSSNSVQTYNRSRVIRWAARHV